LLIVDDEPDLLRLTTLFLRKKGYEILTATDGEMAVKVAQECLPDFILLDVKLPKLNGYEVFEKIRADKSLPRMPIIFATADASVHVSENTTRLGAEGYLLKPFDAAALIQKIEQCLN
jgi:DNA-binding response OmpR family regulator